MWFRKDKIMYERPAFLEQKNYASYEEYYENVTGQKIEICCPYCGITVAYAEAILGKNCDKCGGKLTD